MAAKGEALAKQFEAKVQEATGVMEKVSDADWKKITAAEQWTVAATAHHVARGHEAIAGILKTVASGQSIPNFTMDMLHASNAQHAKEFADCTKADTIALHKKSAATAAAIVRGISDEQFANSGVVLKEMPAMSAEQITTGILINHIDDHFGSIRKTIGG